MWCEFEEQYKKLLNWAKDELAKGNRHKASRIQRVADKLEYSYVNSEEDINLDEYCYGG